MSSSQPPSNNSNNNNSTHPNQFLDYETDESVNAPRYPQEQLPGQLFDNRGQSNGNDFFQQMYHFQEDIDEDLPNEIVAELDARDRLQSNMNDEDESVFSDIVQDAFKKYQNEYSKYWIYNDTIWENKFSDEESLDEEQEELYTQMEECWNYMTHENPPVPQPKPSIDQSQLSQLNPDAIEFHPSWLKSSTDEELPSILTSSQSKEQPKEI